MYNVQLDDNLVNGQTYVFQFQLTNRLLNPSVSTVLNDVVSQAPDFLTSVGVTMTVGLSALFYNVQFTYEGDNTDVVSDVANSLVAAFSAGSNDNFLFLGGTTGSAPPDVPAGQAVPTPVQAGQAVITGAGTLATTTVQQAGTVATAATAGAGAAVQSALGGILPVLAVVVLIILFVLPSLAKTKGEAGL